MVSAQDPSKLGYRYLLEHGRLPILAIECYGVGLAKKSSRILNNNEGTVIHAQMQTNEAILTLIGGSVRWGPPHKHCY